MSVFMQPIYTQTVGAGGASSITFNNIPQGFTDLFVQYSLRSDFAGVWADGSGLRFNGDTSSSGSMTQMYGLGTSAGQGNGLTAMYIGIVTAATNTAGIFSKGTINIPNYTGGKFKQAIVESANKNDSTSTIDHMVSNLWSSTAPVTSLTITCGQGNFVQGSTVTLYGTGVQFAGGAPTAPTITSVTDEAGFVQVAFTPVANDQASSYAVTSIPSGVTTYGASSPIDTPAALNTSYAYQVSAVNARGTSASANSSPITTFNSYASIATFTVSGGTTTSFTFNNIPQQYKHLELRCIGRSGTGTSTQIDMNFNGDGGNNYTFHQFYGTASGPGTSATSTGRSNYPDAVLATLNSGNQSGVSILKIQDYSAVTKNKTVFQLYGYDFVGTGTVQFTSGMWMSLAPISSITFTARTQNIGNFTQIALYGIA